MRRASRSAGRSGRVAGASRDPWLPVEAVIREIRRETDDTRTYTLAFKDPALQRGFSFRPGQYNMVGFPGLGEAAISLSSDPGAGAGAAFQHTVREAGGVTGALARMQPDDVVGVRGPFGRPWPMEEASGGDLLLIAGGTGMASLRSALEEALRRRGEYGEITLLYGARTPRDLLFTSDFDRWSAQRDVQLLLTVDRADGEPWKGHVGVVPTLLPVARLAPGSSAVFLCGPEVMMEFTLIDLLKRRFPPERIFLSMERRMRCGVAQCGHCFLGPKFVCQAGPVFRYPDLQGLWGEGV